MLPQFEQQNLANAFNYSLGSEGVPQGGQAGAVAGFFANYTVAGTRVAAFQCPSDTSRTSRSQRPMRAGALSATTATKGNYAVAWGNTSWGQNYAGVPAGATYLQSAFGHLGNISFTSITDGTSNSVFMAEVIQAGLNDVRGLMWDPIAGGSSFMTRYTPNGNQDYLNILPTNPGGDYIESPFCTNDPVHQLPCTSGAGDTTAFSAARQPPFRWSQYVDGRRLREVHQKFDQQPDMDRHQLHQQRRSDRLRRLLKSNRLRMTS